jgi:hypothetical protein
MSSLLAFRKLTIKAAFLSGCGLQSLAVTWHGGRNYGPGKRFVIILPP